MIFYFSGTGNSAWVAQQIARLTQDTAQDISKLTTLPSVQTEKQLGFVFPIYAWGAPEIMTAFAKKLPHASAFTFGVCTCGGDAGLAMKVFSRTYPLDSSYSLTMPNNYINGMDTDTEEVILKKISQAREEMKQISQEILERKRVYRVHEGSLPQIKSSLANLGFNKFARSAKSFFSSSACNSCGLCAANCPASAISLQEGKPHWNTQCYQCMRCINACPQEAIQYGKGTMGRRRYTIWKYLPQEEHL